MVLVDTSVWVRHLREGLPHLVQLLNDGEVMCHPFIVGDLACGYLKNRDEVLSHLQLLPLAIQADHEEALQFLEERGLMGKGLGYIDIHLSASALLTGVPLWTFDTRLDKANKALGMSYQAGLAD